MKFNSLFNSTTQGHVLFSDGQQASLHFSIPKESFNSDRLNQQQKTDWTCYKVKIDEFYYLKINNLKFLCFKFNY